MYGLYSVLWFNIANMIKFVSFKSTHQVHVKLHSSTSCYVKTEQAHSYWYNRKTSQISYVFKWFNVSSQLTLYLFLLLWIITWTNRMWILDDSVVNLLQQGKGINYCCFIASATGSFFGFDSLFLYNRFNGFIPIVAT